MVMVILLRLCAMFIAALVIIMTAIKIAEKKVPIFRRWLRAYREDPLDETECQVNDEVNASNKRVDIVDTINKIDSHSDEENKKVINEFTERKK